ncbi:MAG: hypothetical protein QG630_337 [Patescibacteria group bacterium]|nr:hypothetical protein [Patescibacteria group bacterium]
MKKIFFSFIFILSVFLFKSLNAFAADLTFSPSSGSYKTGDYISVDIILTNNTSPINAISGKVSFSKDTISVSSLSKDGSIIKYWTNDPVFSNTGGTINFEGIIPNPGFSGTRTKVLTIRFLAKANGNVNISFANGSVLANDGLATEVVNLLGQAKFSIIDKPVLSQTPTQQDNTTQQNISTIPIYTTSVFTAPEIISSTHPDQDIWYVNNSPTFNWTIPKGVTAVRLSYDNNKEAKPTNVYNSAINSKSFNNLKDGSYFLHAQFKFGETWGDIATYKFQIDTTPPVGFIPIISYTKEGVPALNFRSNDSASGIDHYEIIIDKNAPIVVDTDEAGVPYVLPKNSEGSHLVVLSAIDKAGNASAISIPVYFINQSITSSVFSGINFIIISILIIIILAVIIWFALVRFRILKSKMGHDLESIVDTMKEDFVMLRENFDIHNSSASKAKTAKEKEDIKKILKTSRDHLDLVERDIGHKIKTLKDRL